MFNQFRKFFSNTAHQSRIASLVEELATSQSDRGKLRLEVTRLKEKLGQSELRCVAAKKDLVSLRRSLTAPTI